MDNERYHEQFNQKKIQLMKCLLSAYKASQLDAFFVAKDVLEDVEILLSDLQEMLEEHYLGKDGQ